RAEIGLSAHRKDAALFNEYGTLFDGRRARAVDHLIGKKYLSHRIVLSPVPCVVDLAAERTPAPLRLVGLVHRDAALEAAKLADVVQDGDVLERVTGAQANVGLVASLDPSGRDLQHVGARRGGPDDRFHRGIPALDHQDQLIGAPFAVLELEAAI